MASGGRECVLYSLGTKIGNQARLHCPISSSPGSSCTNGQSTVRKKISSYNYVCVVLVFAVKCFRAVSAQGNFTLQSAADFSDNNLKCLGGAHIYTGADPTGSDIEVPKNLIGRLSLVPEQIELSRQSAGIAYYMEPVRLLDPSRRRTASFNTSFTIDTVMQFYASPTNRYTGDGLAFVISADSSTLGTPAKSFGFFNNSGMTSFKSIIVEYDQYKNPEGPVYDISHNHMSFDFGNITWVVAANASDVDVLLWYNLTIYAWVEYFAETQSLEARISNNNSRPVRPLLNYTVDLFSVAEEFMWVGFASGTGDSFSHYYIGNWFFESYGIPAMGESNGRHWALIVGTCLGVLALILACVVCSVALVYRRSGGRGWRQMAKEDPVMQLEGRPERFSFKQLSVATGGFSTSTKLGQGGFGSVHRGVLPPSGIPVAVKKINSGSTQGEKEFMAELSVISRLRHRNLIQLLGWCKDVARDKYLLVYELMPNGSLDKLLYSPPEKNPGFCLSWQQRFNIVTGTAAAVDYLHQGWKQQVIHRDIKASNIMLDGEWNAKLGDFGLARLVDHKLTAATTVVAGTYGYIAPEAAASGRFTDKTDVFAFGAVVLELACGRRAFSLDALPEDMLLVDWVWRSLSQGELLSTVDKRLKDYDTYWMEVVLIVGLLSSHPNPAARPSMRQIVQVLAGDAPVPPIPASKPTPFSAELPTSLSFKDLHSPRGVLSASRSRSFQTSSIDSPNSSVPDLKAPPFTWMDDLRSPKAGSISKSRSGSVSLAASSSFSDSISARQSSRFGTTSSSGTTSLDSSISRSRSFNN